LIWLHLCKPVRKSYRIFVVYYSSRQELDFHIHVSLSNPHVLEIAFQFTQRPTFSELFLNIEDSLDQEVIHNLERRLRVKKEIMTIKPSRTSWVR
jgi:hypothetical protein